MKNAGHNSDPEIPWLTLDTEQRRLAFWLGFAAIAVVAAVIRIYGALNDLWLDEIWSLELLAGVSSPLDVFTRIHHDNNHYLNTLSMLFFGPQGNWLGYRVPSLIAGVGAVIMAGLIGRRKSAAAAIAAMLLTGFSYVLVVFSSEARGYAAVVFFSFLSFFVLEAHLKNPTWRSGLIYSVSAIVGIAAHLTFVNFLLAAVAWSVARCISTRAVFNRSSVGILACHIAPVAFLAVLYVVDIRHTAIGGGDPTLLADGFATYFAWSLGAPFADSWKLAACAMTLAVLMACVKLLWRERSDSIVFYAVVIVIAPLVLAVARDANVLYVRYFIVSIAFLLLLVAFALASLCHGGRRGQILCICALLVFCVGNAWHLPRLLKDGRGHYVEALKYLADNTQQPLVTVGSDHDFRVGLVLRFHALEAVGDRPLEYFPEGAWPEQGPEWVVCHQKRGTDPQPVERFTDQTGNRYQLVQWYRTAPLTGFDWFIYHNERE